MICQKITYLYYLQLCLHIICNAKIQRLKKTDVKYFEVNEGKKDKINVS